MRPKKMIVHKAHGINEAGNVSALCFVRPQGIRLSSATWTTRNEAVTCPKCLQVLGVPDAAQEAE